jgi:Zn-dependent metalloprotease
VLLDYSTLKALQAAVPAGPTRTEAVDFAGDSSRTAAAVASGDARNGRGARNGAADEPLRSAQEAIEATRRFFVARMRQFALDEPGAAVPVVVHPASHADWARLGPDYARFFAGAFWDGRTVVLGEGTPEGVRIDGRAWANAAFARDLVAHELAHAVIDRTAGLENRRESGALAEAFADIVAVSAVNVAGDAGARDRYLVGAEATEGGLRSLSDPARHGNPDHVSLLGPDTSLHANSTVVSHAFHLAVEGGANRTSGLAVEGVGAMKREQIEQAFIRAFLYMLPSVATFETARDATLQSARDLFGEASAAAAAIEQAWAAVGVR